MLGLANRSDRPNGVFRRAEQALLYFRRFLAVAPADSPWRRRAEEHVREIAALELPQTVERHSGSAPLDLEVARAVVRRGMPQMRACLAKLPATLFEVNVTRTGPRTPSTVLDRPRQNLPTSNNLIKPALPILVEVSRDTLDAATRCLEPIVARLALPVPKERDTYYMAQFLVIAP
jgi:hypothetical protein